jgi:hypothetical protein
MASGTDAFLQLWAVGVPVGVPDARADARAEHGRTDVASHIQANSPAIGCTVGLADVLPRHKHGDALRSSAATIFWGFGS